MKHMVKLFRAIAIVAIAVFSFVTCDTGSSPGGGDQTGTTIAVTGVSLNNLTISIPVGSTQTLTATVAPANATNRSVTWSSGNTGIATVSANGLVTAVSVGNTTITVTTSDGGHTATSTVIVTATVSPDAFGVYGDFNWHRVSGVVTITGYSGPGGAVVIPAAIEGYPVTAIGASAFVNSNLTSVDIPNSVTSIGDWAFTSNQLTTVNIPNSVTSIGVRAFNINPSLATITIGENVLIDGTQTGRFEGFRIRYESQLRAAGTYTFVSGAWTGP